MLNSIFCLAACFVGPDDGHRVMLGGQSASMSHSIGSILHSILCSAARCASQYSDKHIAQHVVLGNLFCSMLWPVDGHHVVLGGQLGRMMHSILVWLVC